ncbi:MAG TPA: thiopurine S-methyltransferase [Gallionella sp.]|nr:thiopurine S-methyltransferase [Gallionella sp.]
MKKEFWLERWERAEIGFHQDEVNPYLRRFWPELGVAAGGEAGGEIFVPLCGKSLDMVWLREQGCHVLGVELSPIAVQDFFREQGMSPERASGGAFDNYLADGYCLACGDFFDLGRADMAQVSAVYDRASLVALPPEMRERYARHLVSILPAGTRILLVTFDYPQDQMSGPPFAVSEAAVRALYGADAEVRLLATEDVLEQNPRFRQRGVSRMTENIFLLTLR